MIPAVHTVRSHPSVVSKLWNEGSNIQEMILVEVARKGRFGRAIVRPVHQAIDPVS